MLKVNLPSDDEHVAILQRQKLFARELAAKLDNGDTWTRFERRVAAAILRRWAATPSNPPKRGRGAPPKFSGVEAALLVEVYALKLKSRREAVKQVAENYDVSTKAIGDAVRKNRAEARALLDMPGVTVHAKRLPDLSGRRRK